MKRFRNIQATLRADFFNYLRERANDESIVVACADCSDRIDCSANDRRNL